MKLAPPPRKIPTIRFAFVDGLAVATAPDGERLIEVPTKNALTAFVEVMKPENRKIIDQRYPQGWMLIGEEASDMK